VSSPCSCVQGDLVFVARDSELPKVCFRCGAPGATRARLPIYDSRRRIRFTNVGSLVPVDFLSAWFCRSCQLRLLVVRLLPFLVVLTLICAGVIGVSIFVPVVLVPAMFIAVFGPAALIGRVFPSVVDVLPELISFRGMPDSFRTSLPNCDEPTN
jgi:hypothetical protein